MSGPFYLVGWGVIYKGGEGRVLNCIHKDRNTTESILRITVMDRHSEGDRLRIKNGEGKLMVV